MINQPNYSDQFEFLSIVIPAYNRYHYLEECINSIHEHANFPFEIIINDDNSTDGTKEKIISNLSSKVSSVILNNGYSYGLAESINRAVSISGSNYILMLNSDVRVENKFFKDLVNILKVPFVGYVAPVGHSSNNGFIIDGTKFHISRGLGIGYGIGFRKDTWNIVGKFDNFKCACPNSDLTFITKTIKHGYFPAFLESIGEGKKFLSDMSYDRCKMQDSTIATQQHDCSFPKIFGLSSIESNPSGINYEKLCDINKDRCNKEMQISYVKEGGQTNIKYWDNYLKITDENQNVDWEKAKRHGQHKWREDVEKYRR